MSEDKITITQKLQTFAADQNGGQDLNLLIDEIDRQYDSYFDEQKVSKSKTWNPPKSKSKRSEMPASYFLMPKERKFPYKTRTGSISCTGLLQAIRRAQQHGYQSVMKRAQSLYAKHCKKSS